MKIIYKYSKLKIDFHLLSKGFIFLTEAVHFEAILNKSNVKGLELISELIKKDFSALVIRNL
jgi:hypothetical protein